VNSDDRTIVIADACSYAWLQLVRRPDVGLDRRGLNWLTLVATQEAWRLEATRRDLALLTQSIDHADEYEEPPGSSEDPARARHPSRDARRAGGSLGRAQAPRAAQLLLQAAGYSYAEIAGVKRRITEGRAQLRAS